MSRYIIGLSLILFVITGCSNQVTDQSEKTFKIVEKAYLEEREFTDEELKQIGDFKDFAANWKTEHLEVDGTDLTKKEQKEAEIMNGVEWIITLQEEYDSLSEEDLEVYQKKFKETQQLIEES